MLSPDPAVIRAGSPSTITNADKDPSERATDAYAHGTSIWIAASARRTNPAKRSSLSGGEDFKHPPSLVRDRLSTDSALRSQAGGYLVHDRDTQSAVVRDDHLGHVVRCQLDLQFIAVRLGLEATA